MIWALHVGGKQGVEYFIDIMKKEMEINMVLLDTLSLDKISAERNIHKIRPRL
jgi:isopentenyl diphosphate isomerase/L-lactate dehydrogenase-like FMN-dependent dehydrogenase